MAGLNESLNALMGIDGALHQRMRDGGRSVQAVLREGGFEDHLGGQPCQRREHPFGKRLRGGGDGLAPAVAPAGKQFRAQPRGGGVPVRLGVDCRDDAGAGGEFQIVRDQMIAPQEGMLGWIGQPWMPVQSKVPEVVMGIDDRSVICSIRHSPAPLADLRVPQIAAHPGRCALGDLSLCSSIGFSQRPDSPFGFDGLCERAEFPVISALVND